MHRHFYDRSLTKKPFMEDLAIKQSSTFAHMYLQVWRPCVENTKKIDRRIFVRITASSMELFFGIWAVGGIKCVVNHKWV